MLRVRTLFEYLVPRFTINLSSIYIPSSTISQIHQSEKNRIHHTITTVIISKDFPQHLTSDPPESKIEDSILIRDSTDSRKPSNSI